MMTLNKNAAIKSEVEKRILSNFNNYSGWIASILKTKICLQWKKLNPGWIFFPPLTVLSEYATPINWVYLSFESNSISEYMSDQHREDIKTEKYQFYSTTFEHEFYLKQRIICKHGALVPQLLLVKINKMLKFEGHQNLFITKKFSLEDRVWFDKKQKFKMAE